MCAVQHSNTAQHTHAWYRVLTQCVGWGVQDEGQKEEEGEGAEGAEDTMTSADSIRKKYNLVCTAVLSRQHGDTEPSVPGRALLYCGASAGCTTGGKAP
eukprot:248223-Rhodomonas_salina.1